MSWFLRCSVAAMALACSSLAQAAWHKASSKHFIIYSQQRPEQLRAYAEKLERFDQAARRVLAKSDPAIGDGNRLSIFVLDDVEAVQKLHGTRDDFLAGFYVGRYSGSVAFTPRRAQEGWDGGLKADSVFFHEYNHHLMFQQFDQPYPNWYIEGFAELLGTPKFGRDGSVTIGIAPLHRAGGLASGGGLTTRQLLESQPAKLNADQRESIYGRGWLLTHYLNFEPSRSGQLARYIDQLAKGQAPGAAATNAFGDLKLLDREIERYLDRSRLKALTVSGAVLKVGAIEITPLSAGAGEAMPLRMLSKRGVSAAEAKSVVEKLRSIGSRNPNDAFVQGALAEAEYDAGNHKASLAAAEAALRADPRSVEAMVYKGRALTELAADEDQSASFGKAREAYLAANRIDAEDPEPLFLYYLSFLREGKRPTANAIAALHYASVLAPQDTGLRITSALSWLDEGKLAEARLELLPIAFNPHGGDEAKAARAAMAKIDAKDAKGAIAAFASAKPDEQAAH